MSGFASAREKIKTPFILFPIPQTAFVIPNGCEESYWSSGFLKAKISPGVYPEQSEGVEMTGRKSL